MVVGEHLRRKMDMKLEEQEKNRTGEDNLETWGTNWNLCLYFTDLVLTFDDAGDL